MRAQVSAFQDMIAVRAGTLALTLSFSMSLIVSAQAFEATEAQREACTPDAFRLCSAEIPDADRVAACMNANVANLSPPCRAVFQPAEDITPAPRRVRKADRRTRHHYYTREEERRGTWARD
jgi:hypothetical protein